MDPWTLAPELTGWRQGCRFGQFSMLSSHWGIPIRPPAASLRSLLRVPPFPGARATTLSKWQSPSAALENAELDRIICRAAELKVGGAFWAAQPPLPAASYTLIRVADDYLRSELAATAGLSLKWTDGRKRGDISGDCDPWHLLRGAKEVVVDAGDELALIAAIAGVPVRCVGDGRFAALEGGGWSEVRDGFRRAAVAEHSYMDPYTGETIGIAAAIELCGFWRRHIDANRHITRAVGFAHWKRDTVAPLLWGGAGPVRFCSNGPFSVGDVVAVWKSRTPPRTLAMLEASGAALVEVEDGFIRSAGLGADCVPPLSIVIDSSGIYFDPQRESELETLLQNGNFSDDVLDRARQLRERIVELGISKYAAADVTIERRNDQQRHILVPGQVEDDRSIICGGGGISTNLELLRRVRERCANACIIYKPHPDVEAGHRVGAIPDNLALTLADAVVRDAAISSLITMVDEVHVNTSLAGFEALLRRKPVTTYGVPFYAGWGLTTDLGSVPDRRAAKRTLDELVAAALLLYPRYLDPATGLPCPPEILVQRLSGGTSGTRAGAIVRLRRLQGQLKRAASALRQRQ